MISLRLTRKTVHVYPIYGALRNPLSIPLLLHKGWAFKVAVVNISDIVGAFLNHNEEADMSEPEVTLTKQETVRLIANISVEVAAAMEEISKARGISMTEVLRRAISHEKFLINAVDRGDKVLLEKPSGKFRQLTI
ncbi:MAG: hypothetical protein WCD70_06885 [Alphaproteobacteria bacterium]